MAGGVWGGHAWQGQGDMHGKGGMCGRGDTTIYGQSMHRQYTSYWNAFLLKLIFNF